MQILELFPTPVMIVNIKEEIKESEIFNIKKLSLDKKNLIPNGNNGNFFHKNVDVLKNHIPNSKLEKTLNKYIDIFLKDIWLEKEAELVITSSWFNINPKHTIHHEHRHPNSILSGVLYLNTDEKSGDFVMYNSKAYSRQVSSFAFGSNKFVEKTKNYCPKLYDLVIFPSDLKHSVLPNASNYDRMSLSFNTFYNGEIYMNPRNAVTSLTGLKLSVV